jgi:hypothetical protein
MYQHLTLQDPPEFTQIWIFCLKTNHLATLPSTAIKSHSDPASLWLVGKMTTRISAKKGVSTFGSVSVNLS